MKNQYETNIIYLEKAEIIFQEHADGETITIKLDNGETITEDHPAFIASEIYEILKKLEERI